MQQRAHGLIDDQVITRVILEFQPVKSSLQLVSKKQPMLLNAGNEIAVFEELTLKLFYLLCHSANFIPVGLNQRIVTSSVTL